jgi:hypothetical protein
VHLGERWVNKNGAIVTCYRREVVRGIGGGLFAPNADLTRAQPAVFLYKSLMLP